MFSDCLNTTVYIVNDTDSISSIMFSTGAVS